jgi:hypothetical protein
MAAPTPYPDLNEVLGELVAGARDVLGEDLVAACLQGSFAVGDRAPAPCRPGEAGSCQNRAQRTSGKRSTIWSAVRSSTQKATRKCPGRANVPPGTTSSRSFIARATKASSSPPGVRG